MLPLQNLTRKELKSPCIFSSMLHVRFHFQDAQTDVTANEGEDEPNGDLPFLLQDESSDTSSCDDNTDIQSNSEMASSGKIWGVSHTRC